MEWVEAKVSELAVLLPDIVVKLDRIKADVLLQLLEDTQVQLFDFYLHPKCLIYWSAERSVNPKTSSVDLR